MRIFLSGVLVLMALSACDKQSSVQEITQTRERPNPVEAPPANATSAERFGVAALPPGHMPAASPPGSSGEVGMSRGDIQFSDSTSTPVDAPFTWQVPEGWQKAIDRAMRLVTYTFGSSGAECYVALLSGEAGGPEANIDRWRKQMGQPSLTPDEFAALPRITVFGAQAPLIEASGTFVGMGGQEQPGYLLLGVAASLDGQSVFVKMVGPEADVRAQRDAFVRFCESFERAK